MAEHAYNTKPDPVSSTRRKLLSGAAAVLTGTTLAAVVLSPDPTWSAAREPSEPPLGDEPLLALLSDFTAIEQQIHDLHSGDEDADEDQRLILMDQQDPIVEQLCEARATTLAGLRARARAYVVYDPQDAANLLNSGLTNQMMLGALLRDLGALPA